MRSRAAAATSPGIPRTTRWRSPTADILETDIRIYLLSVLRHANAEILPVDWRETVAEFKTTLAAYEAAAADHADLTPARTALDALSERLAELYRAIEAGRVEPGVANDALMRLARVLVPINFTREPRFRHDPAYTVPPLPSLAVAAELARIDASRLGFAKTQLLRGQNRFVAALREAERIAARALHPASA